MIYFINKTVYITCIIHTILINFEGKRSYINDKKTIKTLIRNKKNCSINIINKL